MTTTALAASAPSTGGTAGWLLPVLLVASVAIVGALRRVGAHERVVVLRRGRVSAVHGTGLVLGVPLLDRLVRVSLRPQQVSPVVVRGRTPDGFAVTAWASASFRVEDVTVAAGAVDPLGTVADLVEEAVRREVERAPLADLVLVPLGARALLRARDAARQQGLLLLAVEADELELALDADLLAWARGYAARAREPLSAG